MEALFRTTMGTTHVPDREPTDPGRTDAHTLTHTHTPSDGGGWGWWAGFWGLGKFGMQGLGMQGKNICIYI